MSDKPSHYIILVAAGSGSRFGGAVPKQFLALDGMPVAAWAACAFARELPACSIIVALPASDTAHWRSVIEPYMPPSTVYVAGGATRWESVKNALGMIGPEAPAHTPVLVHDAARPLVGAEVIRA
ncbi:MAG: 2-C-methyl-D-erythritol 4-phosphate cytidylyltransferase, partial [Muribaculaceae bacterium]|nr:2-C-methyl-D-erythritol 4-phosphate cytidylyltransferase [Muribaculaceae bacterium]